MTAPPADFFDLTRDELHALVTAWGFPGVHAARLWGYVHVAGVTDWARMPDLPARFRARAEAGLAFPRPVIAAETHSGDGFTRKYLLALADGRRIETVLMRYIGRVTACISSQAGCAMGCVFCATGQMGFQRHLTAGEIVAQALHVDRVLRETAADAKGSNLYLRNHPAGGPAQAGQSADCEGRGLTPSAPALARPESPSAHERHERLRNVVLMGMGEPLHNYDAVLKAVDILRDPSGLALGARKITLSTVGVVPGIVRLADERRPVSLAVSLHGATQEERAALVPVAARWPLDELMQACRYYQARQGRRIFYEWTLIEGRNDTPAQAEALGRLLRGQDAQVNLIPLNPTGGYAGTPSGRDAAREFQRILAGHGLPSTIRQRRGIDIAAGCGQLAVLPVTG